MALHTKLLYLFVCLLPSIIPDSAEGRVFTAEQETSLLAFVHTLMECRGITGLSLAVVRGNETWTRGFGMADRDTGRNVTSSTLFGIGSITKSFTTTMLYHLLDKSDKYSWETLVVDILGDDFQFVNDDLTRHVTLKDLLVHRTGLMATDIPLFANLPDGLSTAEFAQRLRYMPASKVFRDGFEYNNWMYGLAGRVVEVLGGASWEDHLQASILRPIGMADTRVLGKTVTVEASNFARPYILVGEDVVLCDPSVYSINPLEAAGAIASSADDMAKWLQHLLNANETFTKKVMSPYISLSPFFSRRCLWKPDFPITYLSYGYGYAWVTSVYRGYSTIYHSGGFYAYISYKALIPDIGLGVFVSSNGPGGINASTVNREIFYYIADIALGEEPWLNLNNACQFPDLWVNKTEAGGNETHDTVPSGELFQHAERYAGSYGHLLFGVVQVTLNGSEGRLAAKFNRMEGRLLPTDTAENVALLEIFGALEFLRHLPNKTIYLNFTFSKPSSGQMLYQELEISAPDMGEKEVLVFQRGVKYSDFDPNGTSSSGTCGGCGGVVVVCLIVAAGVLVGGVREFFISLV